MSVILETTKGDLTVDLFIKERPKSEPKLFHFCAEILSKLSTFYSNSMPKLSKALQNEKVQFQ